MPTAGLFDSFDNLDQIAIEKIARWLKKAPSDIQLENYLATRILYPQTVPLTTQDMGTDLAILREALRMNAPVGVKTAGALLGENPFLNITLRKVLIPAKFLPFIPNLVALTWAFVDAFFLDRRKEDLFSDIWTVVLVDEVDEVVGSILLPQFESKRGDMELVIDQKNYKIRSGSLTVIPCPQGRCEIIYKFNQGKILGKKESALDVYGGRLGLMIDGRFE